MGDYTFWGASGRSHSFLEETYQVDMKVFVRFRGNCFCKGFDLKDPSFLPCSSFDLKRQALILVEKQGLVQNYSHPPLGLKSSPSYA